MTRPVIRVESSRSIQSVSKSPIRPRYPVPTHRAQPTGAPTSIPSSPSPSFSRKRASSAVAGRVVLQVVQSRRTRRWATTPFKVAAIR